jgi:hypothetical protein
MKLTSFYDVHNLELKLEILLAESQRIGKWLSAALEDEHACDEFKTDIRAWFEALNALEAFKK